MFSTIAVVFRHGLFVLKIALWALPIIDHNRFFILLLIDVINPLFDALKMHGDIATCATPNPIFATNTLRTDNTCILILTALSSHESGGILILLQIFSYWSFMLLFSFFLADESIFILSI